VTAYATASDVAALLGRDLDPHDAYTTDQQLEVASAIVRARVPDIDTRLGDATLDPALVRDVVAKAVHRFMRNRLGLRSEGVGAYSVSYGDAGNLVVTDEEIASLVAVPTGVPGVGSIRLTSPWLHRSGADDCYYPWPCP
jgi:hypothetical protein